MRKIFYGLALFFSILLTGSFSIQESSASEGCVGLPPEKHFEKADLIFSGRVIDIFADDEMENTTFEHLQTQNVTFEVLEQWKGDSDNIVTIQFPKFMNCGLEINNEGEYFVYAVDENGQFRSDFFLGTVPLYAAKNDLKFINPIPIILTDLSFVLFYFLVIFGIPVTIGMTIFFVVRKKFKRTKQLNSKKYFVLSILMGVGGTVGGFFLFATFYALESEFFYWIGKNYSCSISGLIFNNPFTCNY